MAGTEEDADRVGLAVDNREVPETAFASPLASMRASDEGTCGPLHSPLDLTDAAIVSKVTLLGRTLHALVLVSLQGQASRT